MNIVNKPIEMVAAFNTDGGIAPIRFRVFDEEGSFTVCTINRVLRVNVQKIGKAESIYFSCNTVINSISKNVEIKYDKDTFKWYIWKM